MNLLVHWCDESDAEAVNVLLMIPIFGLGGHSINTSNVVLLLMCLMVFPAKFMEFCVSQKEKKYIFCRFESEGF